MGPQRSADVQSNLTRIANDAILRQLIFSGSGNAFEERTIPTLDSYQKVRTKETLIQHSA